MGEKNDVGYIALRLGKYRKQWKQLIHNEDKHNFFFFGGGAYIKKFYNTELINGWLIHDTQVTFSDSCTILVWYIGWLVDTWYTNITGALWYYDDTWFVDMYVIYSVY